MTHTRTKPLYRATQIVWYVLDAITALLLLRFALRLFAANPASSFTDLVYQISSPFVAPFFGVFDVTRSGNSILEWTTLLAIAVCWILGSIVVKLIAMGAPVSEHDAAEGLRRNEDA